MIGVIKGATIMAPMIAGALLASSPKVAMAVANANRTKKLTVGNDAAFISVAIWSGGIAGS